MYFITSSVPSSKLMPAIPANISDVSEYDRTCSGLFVKACSLSDSDGCMHSVNNVVCSRCCSGAALIVFKSEKCMKSA